ncbi:pyridoxamine 5 -phosphate oxidase [Ophiostoma piceae UAMH 11346]|uniref:pyridoxal 5'-phosphate synthase n=1 Tax=Ophiostoma piceae (strain UAMH 11346) TaxID=1262450 RepID=S3CEW1_OPHP1|nr:pyridoxamine 5 -phosphate oxidase [Ophiostoma piceae UAMH 11346]
MALYPPPPDPASSASSAKTEKLIFAPTPDAPITAGQAAAVSADTASAPPQAGQFLKSETRGGLRKTDLDPDSPIKQFHTWFAEAKSLGGIAHPETCTLSTASLPSGRVSARMVYLKELDHQGFVLYSNFGTSRKGDDLFGSDEHPPNGWASLTFWWESLERQVRVEGRVSRLPAAESQVYFDTRVRGSRVGAWASRQSAVLEPATDGAGADGDDGRAQLDKWVAETQERFAPKKEGEDDQIPVPDFWGGLRIVPERVEFWQGRQNRLHDRFVYDRVTEGAEGETKEAWTVKRLSP